jgi:hypothetical protein
MNLDLEALASRREALVARSASERAAIVRAIAQIQRRVGFVERAIGLIDRVRRQPVVIALLAGVLLRLGPRRAIRWLGRGIALASLLAPLRRFLDAGARAQAASDASSGQRDD